MQNTATQTQETNFFQIYYSNKFKDRDYRVVAAKTDIEAIGVLQNNEPHAKNAYAQQITKEAYEKMVANLQNPCCSGTMYCKI